MKTKATAKFWFLFLFLFISTRRSVHSERVDLVNDSKGRALLIDRSYFILLDNGGSITAVDTSFCQISVIQLLHNITIPSKISISHDSFGFITTGFPISISFPSFTVPSLCISSNKWVVVKSKPLGKHVMVGDEADYDNVVCGSFYLKTYDYDKGYYKPVFCEGEGESDCTHIGVQFDDEYFRRLVVTDHLEPLIFKFVMAEDDSFALEDSSIVRTW
ncbi:kunitz-type serine protease inhibitor DrTI-like [Neltuma alba]|uniref:kunitz-type serine protease inhibitor DrTI-like n=1 Tax=Neltuma alba TaxID=207710 RepID=UPI0010A3D0E3|nr:kunitz-type serine protease inhibitor DrTI-like [Prosopis alba]